MNDRSAFPVTVYGSSISYFTGKVETYFRVKGIPYRFEPMKTRSVAPIVKKESGSTQVPLCPPTSACSKCSIYRLTRLH